MAGIPRSMSYERASARPCVVSARGDVPTAGLPISWCIIQAKRIHGIMSTFLPLVIIKQISFGAATATSHPPNTTHMTALRPNAQN
eukprot:scaffold280686_cov33-Tisochrysis_lutea.AAC.3